MSVRNRSAGRILIERAGHRWPSVLPRAAQTALSLPQGSRVRRAVLRQVARTAFEVWNSGDFEIVPYIDDPEVETHVTLGSGLPIGFDTVYYGPEGHCRLMENWNEAWGKWDAEIEDVIEEGRDRILVLAHFQAEGSASGVKLNEWGAVRYTFRKGRIVRVDGAFDPDRDRVLDVLPKDGAEALEAAGLSE
jgi:ketosteroid isomerase-like protein